MVIHRIGHEYRAAEFVGGKLIHKNLLHFMSQ